MTIDNKTRRKLNKILKVDISHSDTVCPYCFADINDPTWDDMENNIANCTNCQIDITMKGEWTGWGFEFVVNLYKKYPDDSRWLKLLKMWI